MGDGATLNHSSSAGSTSSHESPHAASQTAIGPVGWSQYQYTAVISSPASTGMYAAAAEPGWLHARCGESWSKMGSMESQGRWTSQGWESWDSGEELGS